MARARVRDTALSALSPPAEGERRRDVRSVTSSGCGKTGVYKVAVIFGLYLERTRVFILLKKGEVIDLNEILFILL